MAKKRAYRIGADVLLEAYEDKEPYIASDGQNARPVVRYLAAGIMRKNKFSGLIMDYEGGGCYGEHVVLDGKEITSIENDGADSEYEELVAAMDAKYPGLSSACFKVQKEIVYSYDAAGIPRATWSIARRFAKKEIKDGPNAILISRPYIRARPLVGNTVIKTK